MNDYDVVLNKHTRKKLWFEKQMGSKGVKKCRKKRGHVSQGHGRVGKHRKHPAGRGAAGGLTHHRNLFVRHHPSHFGKKGKRNYHEDKNSQWMPYVNVERLWAMLSDSAKKPIHELEQTLQNANQVPVLDVTKHGYNKVLGTGFLREKPIVVKAKQFSAKARQKIEGVGGACVLVA